MSMFPKKEKKAKQKLRVSLGGKKVKEELITILYFCLSGYERLTTVRLVGVKYNRRLKWKF